MNNNIKLLIDTLESLLSTIEMATFNAIPFDQQHGWNQVYLDQKDVENFIKNLIKKLNSYSSVNITDGFSSTVESHINNINRLNNSAKTYFTNNASHLIHFVPSIFITLYAVESEVNNELFSFENIESEKLLPKDLARNLRATKSRLDRFYIESQDIQEKIKTINDAHEAAESLPTDLEDLRDAKQELNALLKMAKKEFEQTKKEIIQIKEDSAILKSEIKATNDECNVSTNEINNLKISADALVAQCDDALQITTTQGLAAGFDQKANQLKSSIWVWIAGLLVALISAYLIGSERVNSLTEVLNKDITSGQAILHTVMAIISIGGPLWLAWMSTQQINQRFKLSEDYAYKATVAKSFTGFKKFASKFDEETEKRLFNSTLDRFDEMPLRLLSTKDYSSPWHEFTDSEIFKQAIRSIPALAIEAGKFADKVNLKRTVPIKDSISPKVTPIQKTVVDE
ncbi:hypothetical protein C9I43_14200 [Shewanella morhuae]|uniref:Uncharacterized protein n=1 Tax=Shewanella morhuae TaxID=365591 RepID=A0ABX5HXC8_9GAMM|nr:hypothetical protein [Shewanella morhuae]PTA51562.1 hypothetical protein C9I43_14200 [Shewanella morhuae]